jgi:uncharacterized protein with HEPN domain
MRSDAERLRDILHSIVAIEKYTKRGRSFFYKNELVQSWVMRHLEIIGEAANHASAELREKRPEIPWRNIIGMRNILAHGYFEIDTDTVWKVVENDLPSLRKNVKKILKG